MDEQGEKLVAAADEDMTADLVEAAPPRAHHDPEPESAPRVAVAALPLRPTALNAPRGVPPYSTDIDILEGRGPPKASEPTPGRILRDRYVIEEPIAIGGTAVVYRARDLRRDAMAYGGQSVAIKILKSEQRQRPQSIARLRREFQYAQMLSHPNIARVIDFDCDAGLFFLTLELLEGDTLAALLRQQGTEPVPARRGLDILRACSDALTFAHERGVVHGDFKPGNVFLTRNGQVRVLDFGAASASWQPGETYAPAATPPYASPQVLEGQRPERRDDVFSFGCVAYEMLNGRHPFGRHSSYEARASRLEVPRAWHLTPRQWHALEAALSWDRDERPGSPRALYTELASTDLAEPLVIPEVHEQPRPVRGPPFTPIAVIAVLAVLGLSAFVARLQLEDRHDAATSASLASAASALQRGNATQPGAPAEGKVPPVRDEVLARSSPSSHSAQPARAASSTDNSRASGSGNSQPAAIPATPKRTWTPAPEQTGSGPLISFDEPAITVSEGAVAAVIRLNRRQQLTGRAQVRWRTLAGSALPGRDYSEIPFGVAEFADGQTTRAIYVPLLNDHLIERDRRFAVELYSPDGNTRIYPNARIDVIIHDDD